MTDGNLFAAVAVPAFPFSCGDECFYGFEAGAVVHGGYHYTGNASWSRLDSSCFDEERREHPNLEASVSAVSAEESGLP